MYFGRLYIFFCEDNKFLSKSCVIQLYQGLLDSCDHYRKNYTSIKKYSYVFFNGHIHIVLKMRLSIEKNLILKYFVVTKMSQISSGNYEYINVESQFKLRMVQLEILVVVIINTIKYFVDQLRY